MNAKEYVKNTYDVNNLKELVKRAGKKKGTRQTLLTMVSGSYGQYIGHVLCEALQLTPKQLGLGKYVSKGEEDNGPVDYVELAEKHNLESELFDPFITHFNWMDEISSELSKQLGAKVEIDVLEADNSVCLFLV